MLKTVKVNKRMKLDELIKYVRENKENLFKECVSTEFKTENNKEIIFIDNGNFVTADRINIDDLFKVEVEEPIMEDTIFQELYSVYYSSEKSFRDIYNNASINDIILEDGKQGIETERIYALYKGKIELIWERED